MKITEKVFAVILSLPHFRVHEPMVDIDHIDSGISAELDSMDEVSRLLTALSELIDKKDTTEREKSQNTGRLRETVANLQASVSAIRSERETIDNILQRINYGFRIEEILNYVYEMFSVLMPVDRMGFTLLEENGHILRAKWARSTYKKLKLANDYKLPLAGSSLETILETNEPRIINDLQEYYDNVHKSESTKLILKEGILSSLTCPLIARGRPIGFLFFSSCQKNAFHKAHAHLFSRVSWQISVAIEKSLLYEKVHLLNQTKDSILSMVAHDMRNPLTVVLGSVRLLTMGGCGELTAAQKRVLESVDIAGETMMEIIASLLETSEYDSGAGPLNKQYIDVRRLLGEKIHANNIAAENKNISLKLVLKNALGTILIDNGKIGQVMDNLISNAIKYSFEDTAIEIHAERMDHALSIAVIDQGQGIPASEQHKLFKDFGRTTVQSTSGEKSIGLGLSICKRIIDAHEGKIYCKSEAGQGSEFIVELPLG